MSNVPQLISATRVLASLDIEWSADISGAVSAWAKKHGIKLTYIQPGNPQQKLTMTVCEVGRCPCH